METAARVRRSRNPGPFSIKMQAARSMIKGTLTQEKKAHGQINAQRGRLFDYFKLIESVFLDR